MAVYFALQIFEPAWYLRGMDQFLVDMLEDEAMTQAKRRANPHWIWVIRSSMAWVIASRCV